MVSTTFAQNSETCTTPQDSKTMMNDAMKRDCGILDSLENTCNIHNKKVSDKRLQRLKTLCNLYNAVTDDNYKEKYFNAFTKILDDIKQNPIDIKCDDCKKPAQVQEDLENMDEMRCREDYFRSFNLRKQPARQCYATAVSQVEDLYRKMGIKGTSKFENIDSSRYGNQLTENEWNQLKTTVNEKGQLIVLHVKGEASGQHWIVPYRISDTTVYFYDPAGGRLREMSKTNQFFSHPSQQVTKDQGSNDAEAFYRYYYNPALWKKCK